MESKRFFIQAFTLGQSATNTPGAERNTPDENAHRVTFARQVDRRFAGTFSGMIAFASVARFCGHTQCGVPVGLPALNLTACTPRCQQKNEEDPKHLAPLRMRSFFHEPLLWTAPLRRRPL
jgi:hypothetical protein